LPTTVDWRFVRVLFLVTIKIWGEGRGYYWGRGWYSFKTNNKYNDKVFWGEGRGYYWGRGYLSKTKNKFNDKILNELTAFYNYWSNDKE